MMQSIARNISRRSFVFNFLACIVLIGLRKPRSQKLDNLSGGNQQKIVIGKWLITNSQVLILDEPTRGIDVGSKSEIYRLIRELAKSGYAFLVISSEILEVIGVSDRVIALYDGRITAEFDGATFTEDQLVQAMTA
jgi:ribose transport system ATP-binding protein